MKRILFTLTLFISAFSFSQDFSSGALQTDAAAYQSIGQAPLPVGSNIPALVDLGNSMPPPGNQYPQNSCVAWAVAYANYSYLNSKSNNCNYVQNGTLNSNCLFSPSFVYNQINGGQNRGTYFTDAFQIMKTQGVAPMSVMPYNPNNWTSQPSAEARQLASRYKILSYWQLGTSGQDFFNETKAYLAKGIPVIAAVKVDNYLKRTSNFATPYVWTNWSGTVEQMGHAILVVGYDDNNRRFKFINSYGTQWGNGGYGYISYDMYRQVLYEAYIIRPQNENLDNQDLLATDDKQLSNNDVNAGLNFSVDRVEHFQFAPGYIPTPQEFLSKSMTLHGSISIPAGTGQTVQVVVYFYYNVNGQKGPMVGSLNPMTSTISGQAATGTPPLNLNPQLNFNNTWFAQFRYADLNIQRGLPYQLITTHLVAEPVLLIDGFPVRIGNAHLFFVNM